MTSRLIVNSIRHTGASATSSKIFVMASLNIGLNNDNEVSFAFFRGGSILTGAIGDAAGSRTRTGFGGKLVNQPQLQKEFLVFI